MMNYTEFLEYIYRRYSGNVKLGLDRITGILSDMGNPQSQLHGMHIGGTNGKGSVCAALEALASAHGLHTGMNTSPHLIDYCERFRIDGGNVEFSTVLDVFHRHEEIFTKWDASFFEITTAIAFQLFADQKVETSVIEVGLGGRLDATNLFIPEVSAITTIGLDHVKTLGDSLEQIAFEKAGIIKQGIPLVLGHLEPAPRRVILEQAETRQARAFVLNEDILVSHVVNQRNGIQFDFEFGEFSLPGLRANLLGRHQAANLAIALTAFLLYCDRSGLHPDESKLREGLLNIHWRGRMQLLREAPLLIVDGAHNLQGVQTLVNNLNELYPGQKLLFVVSILADKDYEHMLKLLCPLARCFYISKNESERAAEIGVQAAVVSEMGLPCQTAPTVSEALNMALADADSRDVIIGAGSLYTVAEIISSVD